MTLTVRIQTTRRNASNSEDAFVLSGDFSISSNHITAIYGPSGAGKTSLLRCIAGLDKIEDGMISFRDQTWHQGHRQLVPTERRHVGYVFQDTLLFPHLSVLNNLNYAYRRRFNDSGPQPADVIQRFELEPLLEHKAHQLSGGQKQRVAIARTLLSSPALLLMDEPLSALDTSTKQRIVEHLLQLVERHSIPVLYVSHSIHEVCRLANDVVLMEAGKITDTGPLIEKLTSLDSALAHNDEAFSILATSVEQQDPHYQLTKLKLAENQSHMPPAGAEQYLYVPQLRSPIGQPLKVHIAAKDISLSLDNNPRSSILNRLTGTVNAIESATGSSVLIRLTVAEQRLLARITRKSLDKLALKIGQSVYIQIKTVALITG